MIPMRGLRVPEPRGAGHSRQVQVPRDILMHGVEALRAAEVPAAGLRRTLSALGLDPNITYAARAPRVFPGRPIVAVLVALILLGLSWYAWLEQDPGFVAPTAIARGHNAFTNFTAAGVELRAIDRRNGFEKAPSSESDGTAPLSHAEKKRIVAARSPAMRMLRAGFRYEYLEPPARSFAHVHPHYADYRAMARALALESEMYEEEGDFPRANASDLDAMELGVRIQRGANVIGKLVGISCCAIGRKGLWRRLSRLRASECRSVIERLDRIEKRRVPMRLILREEMIGAAAALQEIMRQRGWRARLGQLLGSDSDSAQGFFLALETLRTSKRALLERYLVAMEREIERADRYPDCFLDPPEDPQLPPLVAAITLRSREIVVKDAADKAQNALLAAALALRAYRLDRGRDPADLRELVRAGYLRSVPRDPFAVPGTPLSLRRVAGRLVPYSIGPDLRDNGGAPIYELQAGRTRPSASIQSGSVGDIVAGVNL